MLNKAFSRRVSAIVAAAGLLAAASCGSGDQKESSSDSGKMTLKVGQISNSVAFFPLYVAEQKGFFEKEGVQVGKRPRLGTGSKLAAALTSGGIDVGGGVITDAFNLAQSGQSPRIIADLVNQYYVSIVVGKDFPDKPHASLQQKIRALKGKKIGITGPGSGTEALVTYLFKKAGLDPEVDVTLVNLGGSATGALGALKTGRVDALSFFQPVPQAAEARGIGRIYISPSQGGVPSMKNQAHGVVIATADAVKNKRKAVSAFIRAIHDAEQLINNKPKQAQQLLADYEKELDEKTLDSLTSVLTEEIPSRPVLPKDGYRTAVNFHEQAGLISDAPSYEEITGKQFVKKALNSQ